MEKSREKYHYKESGLDNVYLVSGFKWVESPYGDDVQIQDRKGLHRAIGMMLAEEVRDLSGKEFRFLRHEINMTQKTFADLVHVTDQTVARWEKGETKVDGGAQAVIRMLYLESIGEKGTIKDALIRLAELDEALCLDDELEFEDTSDGWQLADAA